MPTNKQISRSLPHGVDLDGKPLPLIRKRCPFDGGRPRWKAPLRQGQRLPYAIECDRCKASTAWFALAGAAAIFWDKRKS